MIRRWYRTSTSGGCTADRLDLDDGRYALLTDGSEDRECLAPDASTTVYVIGLYTADEDQIDYSEGTREECLAWLAQR